MFLWEGWVDGFISSFLNNNQVLSQYVMDSFPQHRMLILSFLWFYMNFIDIFHLNYPVWIYIFGYIQKIGKKT